MSGNQTGELTIKEIKKKPSSVVVVFSSGEKWNLSPSTFTESPLYEGKTLTEKEAADLLRFQQEEEYYDKALALLEKQNYTVSVLSRKLLDKGADKAQVSSICLRLQEEGLLDDKRYAKTYAEDVARIRCLGKRRVLFDLKKKGIRDDILSSLSFPEEAELEKAREAANLFDRKYARATNLSKKAKVIKNLMERGFSEEIARQAANEKVTMNDMEDEKARLRASYELAQIRYGRKYEGYEKKKRVVAYLLKQGYRYEDILALSGEED